MKKVLFVFFLLISFLSFSQTRYIDDVFSSVNITSDVAYGQNVSILPMLQGLPPVMDTLLCDIYQPLNDTLTNRPVIILIHTGSFLPPVLNGQPTGSKTDSSIVENCKRWAKKGFVAVAMNYRLGWNPSSPSQTIRTATQLQAAYRGIHDAKAMVRYLRKTVAEDGNLYGIDDNKIIVGGQGTGAFISMGYATLDTVSELFIYPKFWDTSDPNPANHTPLIQPDFGIPGPITYGYGNLDGTDTTYYPANYPPFNFPTDVLWNFPNHPSYSSDVSMSFNLGGSLADLDWLDGGQVPHVSFHCENDPFSDIDTGVIIVPSTGDIVISNVVGSRTVVHYNTLFGNNNGFNQSGLNDTLTQLANAYNSAWSSQHGLVYDGLYVFDTPDPSSSPNAYGEMPFHQSSPWDWWDLAAYDASFAALNGAPAGYGAANSLLNNPDMSSTKGRLFLDTIQGYLNPRIYANLFGINPPVQCDLVTTINQSAPSSSSSCDGFILVTSISSASITSYSCTNSQGTVISNNNFAVNLCADVYIYNVVDNLGCTTSDTIFLGNVYGCTDTLANNYEWYANIDDGSCVYPMGCTNPVALNYDPNAIVDDGSCIVCDLVTTINQSPPSSSSSCDGFILLTSISSVPISSYSCTNSQGNSISTNNFAVNLCADTYIYSVYDSLGCSTIDTIFLGDVYGCTDSTAFNFEWYANTDDGSCIPFIYGCVDPNALNYDSLANTDDGSCCIEAFSQIGQDIYGSQMMDQAGYSVSLSGDGNTLAVGSPYSDSNGTNSGKVKLYTKIYDANLSTFTWTQIGQTIYGSYSNDQAGRSLSLSEDGNTVAIGAPFNDGNGTSSGQVKIYQNSGSYWTQIGQNIHGNYHDVLGYSLSLSNDGYSLAIGSPYSGKVWLYEKSGNYWNQIEIIYGYSYNQAGWSVSLSGDGNTLAIGSPNNHLNGYSSGMVELYEKNIFGSWSFVMNIFGQAGDRSGSSVSIDKNGNTLAIGSPDSDSNGFNSGKVKLYSKISDPNLGTWTWTQSGQTIYGGSSDQSGSSVSINADGNIVAIGSPYNSSNGYESGKVLLYENIGSYWNQIGQDINGENSQDEAGWSVSLSGDGNTVAVGLPGNSDNGSYSGKAKVMTNTAPCAGCIDPLALNFDSVAYVDDGSCIFPSGCTDPFAYNYDSLAISDDGSCLYCDLTNTFFINNNTPGNCNGFVVANSSSSNLPISYLWNTGSIQNNLIGLCPGIYTLTLTDAVGCTLEDTVFMNVIYGCTDPLALNYDPNATIDDGSCSYSSNCTSPKPTGLYAYDIIDTRAKIGWDNMNDPNCMVWKYFVRYREVGTSQWTTKSAGVGNGLCNFGLNTVTKQLLNLTPSTTYEFRMKAFYCGGTSSNYSTPVQFTTADVCPDMTNLTTTTFNGNQAKVRFNWDTTGAYTFARILLRVDTAGSAWQTAGGFGIYYPQLFVNKFGLTPGQSYRAQGRTFCDSNITAYRSPTWTAPIFWTQPGSIREEGGLSINNLDIYPNPSRDVFNITFNSDEKQALRIRILSVVGAEVYSEDRENFIGEYTKQVSLDRYGKGIYFLEIETNNGIINKKLILQ